MPNIRKRSGRTGNRKCLVSEREPYCLENRLNSCEVNVNHNDECANNNNNNNNNNNKGIDFQKMVFLRTAHVFIRYVTIHLNVFVLCSRSS